MDLISYKEKQYPVFRRVDKILHYKVINYNTVMASIDKIILNFLNKYKDNDMFVIHLSNNTYESGFYYSPKRIKVYNFEHLVSKINESDDFTFFNDEIIIKIGLIKSP